MLILFVDNVVEFCVLVIFCLVVSSVAERGRLTFPTGILDFACVPFIPSALASLIV